MSPWLQNLLVITAVSICGLFLARRAWKSLTAKSCSHGCGGACAAKKTPAPASPRVDFIPAEMLARKKR